MFENHKPSLTQKATPADCGDQHRFFSGRMGPAVYLSDQKARVDTVPTAEPTAAGVFARG